MSSIAARPAAALYRPVRRIVTGHDAAGRSIFEFDGSAPNVRLHDGAPMVAQVMWATSSMPAPCAGEPDPAPAGKAFRAGPAPNGTVFRIVDFPPDSASDADRIVHELDADQTDRADARHFFFHKTETLDYAIVLEGEIWALMDEGETLMRSGDVLIQRATHHSWSNRTDRYCRMAFVLIDANETVTTADVR